MCTSSGGKGKELRPQGGSAGGREIGAPCDERMRECCLLSRERFQGAFYSNGGPLSNLCAPSRDKRRGPRGSRCPRGPRRLKLRPATSLQLHGTARTAAEVTGHCDVLRRRGP